MVISALWFHRSGQSAVALVVQKASISNCVSVCVFCLVRVVLCALVVVFVCDLFVCFCIVCLVC